ncbi:Multifunctional pyrimidine synthesis protein CAD [Entophlyctis luteolus]|nr:Multifunctional pyrimidine synthesis protein CAD [Entophlyctis luteolus]
MFLSASVARRCTVRALRLPAAAAAVAPSLTLSRAPARRSLATHVPVSATILPHVAAANAPSTSPYPPPASLPEPPTLPAALHLATGYSFKGVSFGAPITDRKISGEVVFTTSLVGYTESMTDPSYCGQILVFAQPLIGNYGVPDDLARDPYGLSRFFESYKIQARGIVVNDYAAKYSHWRAIESLGQWCARYGVPAISGVDTRAIVSLLRTRGSTLGEIALAPSAEADIPGPSKAFENPNEKNLCAIASTKQPYVVNPSGDINIVLIDCGVKQNIIKCLVTRGARVTVVPWDFDITKDTQEKFDGVLLSNGPGDPRHMVKTVENVKAIIAHDVGKTPTPIFGICMGNQVLAMAAGFKAYKMPFGNRGHNQPCIDLTSGRCVITSQNHGYAIDDSAEVPGWIPYFRNANDGSNAGVLHGVLQYYSVQFHPEACGGPLDTDYLFSNFVNDARAYKRERKRVEQSVVPESPKMGTYYIPGVPGVRTSA